VINHLLKNNRSKMTIFVHHGLILCHCFVVVFQC